VTNEELGKLLDDRSGEWRKGFFAAVNLNNDTKAAFLKSMIGEQVQITEEKDGK
jgi:hypothetical protein